METKRMVLAAMLTALSIILDTLFKMVIPSQLIGVPFYAIPLIIGAITLGLKYSLIMAILGDIISVLLAGNSAIMPLFTVSAMMWGLLPGLLLHKKYKSLLYTLIIILITHLLVTSINSFAIYYHITKSIEGLLVELPLRLLLILPNTVIIASLTKAIMEPVGPLVSNLLHTEFH